MKLSRAGFWVMCSIFAVGILGGFGLPEWVRGAASTTQGFTASFEVLLSDMPNVSQVILNHGNPIILIPGATTTVEVNFTMQDGSGCEDVFSSGTVSVAVFRSSLGASCQQSDLNCYTTSTLVHNCSQGSTSTAATATATVEIYYYADATDASSSYEADDWKAQITAMDDENNTGEATSTAVELNTMLAIDLDKYSIDYGEVAKGADTGASNQSTTIDNAGNCKLNIKVGGSALTSGGDSIATSSQHYATTSFTYGVGDNSLSDVASFISGIVLRKLNDLSSFYLASTTNWALTNSLPAARYHSASVHHDGWIYLIAGYGPAGVIQSSTFSGQINENGSITWSTNYYLPYQTTWHDAVVSGDRIYVINGYMPSSATTTVLAADINGDHSLSSWTLAQATPSPCSDLAAASYADFIYRTGGACTAATSGVIYSRVSPTGTLAWTNTQQLPYTVYDHAAIASNGYLYVIGGNAGGSTSTVLFAQINQSDGSLGSWTTTTPLPNTLTFPEVAAANGNIYVAGGATMTSTVLYASINATGSLSQWVNINSMPAAFQYHDFVSDGESLFQLGGSITSTVSYAKFVTSSEVLTSTSTIYWGAAVPGGAAGGDYTSSITYTAVWAP